jgi:hypothetical protein
MFYYNHACRPCSDGFCGAYDCPRCRGSSAYAYCTPCKNCDESNIETCTCGECVCKKTEEECECDLSLKYEFAEAEY